MLGFTFDDSGEKVTAEVLRRKEFVLGKAKLQMASRGVVELADGTVRIFNVRYEHNPNMNGDFRTVGKPWKKTFEELVGMVREGEAEWITEELPEWRRDITVLPVAGDSK